MKQPGLITGFLLTVVFAAVLGILILQIFVAAVQVNQKADELDTAIEVMSSLIGQFKQQTGVDGFLADSDLLPYSLAHDTNGSITLSKYYDKDWDDAPVGEAAYMVKLVIRPDPVYGVSLCMIDAEVYRGGIDTPLIAELSAAKYFGM